jgi:hypothetical protein
MIMAVPIGPCAAAGASASVLVPGAASPPPPPPHPNTTIERETAVVSKTLLIANDFMTWFVGSWPFGEPFNV